ncbi:MAG: hypothetical protein L6R00_15800 [Phycisphaerae bacterium]|nr:hypothetical protein [Phycisphaerae bacterium]
MSSTAGGSATPCFARRGPDCPRGDINCDQIVNAADVPLFVDALLSAQPLSACESYTANVNGDIDGGGASRVDGDDVQAFVDCLLGANCP